MQTTDLPDNDESRPTTALRRDEILGLADRRETQTDAVVPIAMIVDRPRPMEASTQRDIATRMMQPIELESMGYAPLEAVPPQMLAQGTRRIQRRHATGVVVESPPASLYRWLWLACCAVAVFAIIGLLP